MINREHNRTNCPLSARRSFSASVVAASIIRRVLCQTAIWPRCGGSMNCISLTRLPGRMLQGLLKAEGLQTGRLHVVTMMKKMGIEAIYRRPNTSKPTPGHNVYPYLLRKLAVTRPNQVWAMDISYTRRLHSPLDRQTPDQAYFNALTPMMVAA